MTRAEQLSQSAYDRLSAELEDLTTRGRIDIARKIETARELGDLSENGDYHAAKEEQGKMEARIAHLQNLLVDAEIVAELDINLDYVVAGSVVSVLYDGEEIPERMLVGSIEEQQEDLAVVSPGSPLGVALMGASVGDRVIFEAPGGDLVVQVVAIGR